MKVEILEIGATTLAPNSDFILNIWTFISKGNIQEPFLFSFCGPNPLS